MGRSCGRCTDTHRTLAVLRIPRAQKEQTRPRAAYQTGIPRIGRICRKILLLLLRLSRFSRVRLCDHTDSSPPGSLVPGILQARTLE